MRTYRLGDVRGPATLIAVLLLAACGGGGGDSPPPLTPVVYTGTTAAAVVTAANASQLTVDVIGSEDASSTIVGAATVTGAAGQDRSGGAVDLPRRLNRSLRDTVLHLNDAQRVAPAAQVDQTEPCDNGVGSVRITGTLNDATFTGTLAVTFSNCLIDGDTLNGPATLRVDAFSFAFPQGIPSDSTLSFVRLTIRGPGVSVDATGSVRLQLDFGMNSDTVTTTLDSLNNNTNLTSRVENLAFTSVYNNIFTPTSFAASISGKVFDYTHGYVEITTVAPLAFGTLGQLHPDSGQLVLTGAASGRIRATALSAAQARLELDLDGNGAYEIDAKLRWADLSGPAGSDLADDDGDGMHNSWEVANALNKVDPADATLDKDGDGAGNLAEYNAGTIANDATSMPASVNVSILASDSPDPVASGGNLTYSIAVSNSSGLAATGVVLTDTLPAGVNLVSATASQGVCSGTSVVTCNLGTLNPSGSAFVTIVATTGAAGLISNVAALTTSSFDPNTADNTVTTSTTVGQAAAGIQAQIDSAASGDTIVIGPGIYVGGLSFNGKNIALQSSAGPASTILHGNQGKAVDMGPGGTIRGFTITGSSGTFGSGIEVHGAGSLISGNVLDGNSGMSGAGIYGNTASPTIERNVFRNNSCDNQFLSGVVVFVNSSSPVIANNIFENNQCRAINLTLPQGNAPQVINNTFVGNRTGIRVNRGVPQVSQIFRNNIVFQNGIGLEIEFGADADNPVWENNLVFGNTTDYQGTASQTGVNGNLSVSPMFFDAAAGNYRLQAGSPAIDAGNAIGAPAVDFEGTSRPLDGNGDTSAIVDIGAFEAPTP